ncbi:MAG TPA: BCCT family transporter, partial [Marivita sp.]|nr:BCCT family transporter [Marivita sp.]
MAGGLSAIQTAMVIGALPFSVVMVLMGVAVLKAIWRDSRREKAGVHATSADVAAARASVPSDEVVADA